MKPSLRRSTLILVAQKRTFSTRSPTERRGVLFNWNTGITPPQSYYHVFNSIPSHSYCHILTRACDVTLLFYRGAAWDGLGNETLIYANTSHYRVTRQTETKTGNLQ